VFAEDDLTHDGFLGGRLRVWQPKQGFRSSIDAVLLAAAVPAKAGDAVLDLGCGAGVAGLCVAARVPGVLLWGLELQPAYADLARRNAVENGIAFEVAEGDVGDPPEPVRNTGFDHILMNPPYYAGDGTPPRDPGRATAMHETADLAAWLGFAKRRLKPGGALCLIQSAARLGDVLAGLPPGMGSATVLPVAPRAGREAARVIVRARKGGRGALRLLAPFVLHAGATHEGDREDLTDAARAVLREGHAL
jgi:tRNA1(Val) A37 N6-methylase TrmN6